MHPLRKRRLLLILIMLVGLSIAVSLVLYALKQNINLFFTPSQVAAGQAPQNHNFRVGGLVEKNSVVRSAKNLDVVFVITDKTQNIKVIYQGILPDLFREGQGIIAEGTLNAKGEFIAHEVLAKHDEKYMPPQIAGTLAQMAKTRKG